jgi:cytidylate kinase
MTERTVIAIDGPAGSGKSTVARRVAARLGFRYLDTGAMYRVVALLALRKGVAVSDEGALADLAQGASIRLEGDRVFLGDEDVSGEIRGREVTETVSQVATVSGVRRSVVERQRAVWSGEALVVEGRDIGSVVFPDATLKVYLTASPRARARRRAGESGRPVREVLAEILARDARDEGRKDSPLCRAEGALFLDTTGMTIDAVVTRLSRWIRQALER